MFQVQADRAFVAVEIHKLAGHAGVAAALRHGAQEVAAGCFDLDNLRALVRQGSPANRADDDRRHVNDADSIQGTTTHIMLLLSNFPHRLSLPNSDRNY